jgi:hypothetical protein
MPRSARLCSSTHYGSSGIYTFTTEPRAAAKPGSAGKAGLNQRVRIVKFRRLWHRGKDWLRRQTVRLLWGEADAPWQLQDLRR